MVRPRRTRLTVVYLYTQGEPNCLEGLTFVISGVLESLERDDAKVLIERLGGKVTLSLSKKTSYFVVGRDAGASKTAKVGLSYSHNRGRFIKARTSRALCPGGRVPSDPIDRLPSHSGNQGKPWKWVFIFQVRKNSWIWWKHKKSGKTVGIWQWSRRERFSPVWCMCVLYVAWWWWWWWWIVMMMMVVWWWCCSDVYVIVNTGDCFTGSWPGNKTSGRRRFVWPYKTNAWKTVKVWNTSWGQHCQGRPYLLVFPGPEVADRSSIM